MAYTALPLVLSALDIKLSSMTYQMSPKRGLNALDAYSKTIKCFQDQFDGTEEVLSTMERILSEAEAHSRRLALQKKAATSTSAGDNNKDWYEIFLQHPKLHLRVAMAFDLSFSRGRFPEDEDFPRQLRTDRLGERIKQQFFSMKESPRGEDSFLDDELASVLLHVTKSPAQSFIGRPESLPTRTDLDFMELFADEDPDQHISMPTELDFIDSPLDEEYGGGEQDWERTVMDLFDQCIPG